MKDYTLADSGAREEFQSGAVRDRREGKGRFDLISPIALRRLAGVYEKGSRKYGDRNWEKGMPLSRFLDSAERHLNDFRMICQYERDEIPLGRLPAEVDPNEDHLSQALWNVVALLHFEELRPDLDDLTKKAEPTSAKAKELFGSIKAQGLQGSITAEGQTRIFA